MEISEVDYKVWRDSLYLTVELFGSVGPGADILSLGILDCFDFLDQLGPDLLIIAAIDDSLCLSPFHVEEEAPVITSVAPCFGLGPVNPYFVNGREFVRITL